MRARPYQTRKWGWRGWLCFCAGAAWVVLRSFVTGLFVAALLWRNPKVQMWVHVKGLRHQLSQPLPQPAAPALPESEQARLASRASALRSAAALFQPTNVWDVHLRFSSNQWAGLEPKSVPPILDLFQPDGSVILRNPAASRAGLAGVIGLDLPWSAADLEFGDVRFKGVAARFKGNGTFVGAAASYKRPIKIDLRRGGGAEQLAGRTVLNFHNLVADLSCLSDTLGYEFFREAGVPAPRTAFARVRLSVDGRFEDRLLGLYVMVENPDAEWAREQFGAEGVALFKPVTYELFADLGDDWKAYEPIYDPKTKATIAQQRRLMELASFFTRSSDAEFAARVGEFIDLTEFTRFLAGQVLLANYDGILSTGQNFLLYHDPRTDRFGFIPWDLDHCWGEFPFFGTPEQREQASIRRPWVGENRFLERMLDAAPVRDLYLQELGRLRTNLLVPERLNARLDELAAVIRPFVREESTNRLAQLEQAVASQWPEERPAVDPNDPKRPAFPLKRFIAARAVEVSEQLAGRSEGVVIPRKPRP